MQRPRERTARRVLVGALAAAVVAAAALAGSSPDAQQNGYTVHKLVSDQPGAADHVDANLVNA